jgi:hypothetical protein
MRDEERKKGEVKSEKGGGDGWSPTYPKDR